MMNKQRAGFAFELGVIVVILASVAIIALIILFYSSREKEVLFEVPQELLSENNQSAQSKNSYLDKLENYRDKESDVLPREIIEVEDKVNIIERGNEEGQNSLYKTIDSIIEESGTN